MNISQIHEIEEIIFPLAIVGFESRPNLEREGARRNILCKKSWAILYGYTALT